MKILMVMDPGILVPPKGYGGIERIIDLLAREYHQQGHEVHLLVTNGSIVPGCTVHGYGKEGFPPKKKDALKAIPSAWWFLWKHRNHFDLIHNFGRLLYLLPLLNHKVKKLMSYQREITRANIVKLLKFPHRNLYFTGCSQDLVERAQVPGHWTAIHNGVDFNFYQLRENVAVDAPLIFLGRIEKVKGCHTAISIAKATNNKLIIAGNISPLADEKEYYKKEVEPLIDGVQIKFIGPVNDEQKNEWLGRSKALLMPIEWNEPFGIVMIEAMACGTPVIAFNKGSVDEVIEEGVTGYKTVGAKDMIRMIDKLSVFNRKDCKDQAEKKFAIRIIAKKYLSI